MEGGGERREGWESLFSDVYYSIAPHTKLVQTYAYECRMKYTRIQTTGTIIIITTNANNSAILIMLPSWSDIVGVAIVVPFEGSVVRL